MLNFQNLFPLIGISFNSKEKNIGEWSVQKEVRMSVFIIDSCSMSEIRKKIKPWFSKMGDASSLQAKIKDASSLQWKIKIPSENYKYNYNFFK